ncbi:MAG: hypothetical protein ABI983_04325 [Acidobacteriota bacterium]
MTGRDEAIQRVLCALNDEISEHPGHEILEAYVEGRLTPEQRDDLDRLAAESAIVAEDIADLRAIQEAILQVERSRTIHWGRVAAIAAVAGSIVAAIGLGMLCHPANRGRERQQGDQ